MRISDWSSDVCSSDLQQQVIVFFGPGNAEAEQRLRTPEGKLAYGKSVNPVDALRAVGDIDRRIKVVHENTDDFTKAQGDNGQVIAPQLKRGGDQHSPEKRRKHNPRSQQHPEQHHQPKKERSQQQTKKK